MAYSEIQELFDHTRAHVTDEMIRKGIPNDPGSVGYFRRWKELSCSATPPGDWDGDLSEVVHSMSLSGEPNHEMSRFNSFVACIGLHCVMKELDPMPDLFNYHLCSLIFDSLVLVDTRQARLLWNCLATSHKTWEYLRAKSKLDMTNYSWAYFAELMLAGLNGDPRLVEPALERFLHDEATDGNETGGGYALFSTESFYSQHGVWADLATWCLAPFSDLPSVEKILKNIQAWRATALTDDQLSGLNRLFVKRIREIEQVSDARSAGTWACKYPPLSGAVRESFRGRLFN